MLKVSDFYLEKQKSFIPKKKYNFGRSLYIGQQSSNRWPFAVPIFREGFEEDVHTYKLRIKLGRQNCHKREEEEASHIRPSKAAWVFLYR